MGSTSLARECRWKLADRPQGISFSSGRTETAGTTETTGKWQAMLSRLAIGRCEACKPISGAKRLPGTIPVVPAVSVVPVVSVVPALSALPAYAIIGSSLTKESYKESS